MQPRAKIGGFSLVELMVVTAIIGILSTLAISGLSQSMRQAQNYEASWQGMRNLVSMARSEAQSHGSQVAVALSGNQLVAFIDSNLNCQYDVGEQLLAYFPDISAGQPALTSTQTMGLPSGCTTNAGARYLAFQAAGQPVTSDGNFVPQLVFTLADTARNRTKTCTVYVSGYIGCTG